MGFGNSLKWPNQKTMKTEIFIHVFFFLVADFETQILGLGTAMKTARHWLGAADVRGNTSQDAERIQRPASALSLHPYGGFRSHRGTPNPK
jgi:hypothetical protein